MVLFESLGTGCWSHFIATMAVYLAISEIFTVQNGLTLNAGLGVVQDH